MPKWHTKAFVFEIRESLSHKRRSFFLGHVCMKNCSAFIRSWGLLLHDNPHVSHDPSSPSSGALLMHNSHLISHFCTLGPWGCCFYCRGSDVEAPVTCHLTLIAYKRFLSILQLCDCFSKLLLFFLWSLLTNSFKPSKLCYWNEMLYDDHHSQYSSRLLMSLRNVPIGFLCALLKS